MYIPSNIYAELFDAVQLSQTFGDSKVFVDAIPKKDSRVILASYHQSYKNHEFNLKEFVESNFELPQVKNYSDSEKTPASVRDAIELLWDKLTRDEKNQLPQTTLITLPNPFVVPGGRFREIYYWDSYFTMLGLAASGRVNLVESMVANFAFLIDEVGFIPNGNRSYYCTRSQPPVFALMVELLAEHKQDDAIYIQYLPQLKKEYQFWMSGEENLSKQGDAFRRVVKINDICLNRYWDDSDLPRAESYAEDVALAKQHPCSESELFRGVRAACESGWDFSSRWLKDKDLLSSIITTDIVPVDLNAMMYHLETILCRASSLEGDKNSARYYMDRSEQRKAIIQSLFFDQNSGLFVDLSLPELQPSSALSLASGMPLFFNMATLAQAKKVAEKLKTDFLKPGGWVTTLTNSGQQWDAPNGWAPLQWIIYRGLSQYGYHADASEGASRWVKNNIDIFHQTGKFWEKYNVESPGQYGKGGEYHVQEGFGWTNAILLKLMDDLGIE